MVKAQDPTREFGKNTESKPEKDTWSYVRVRSRVLSGKTAVNSGQELTLIMNFWSLT